MTFKTDSRTMGSCPDALCSGHMLYPCPKCNHLKYCPVCDRCWQRTDDTVCDYHMSPVKGTTATADIRLEIAAEGAEIIQAQVREIRERLTSDIASMSPPLHVGLHDLYTRVKEAPTILSISPRQGTEDGCAVALLLILGQIHNAGLTLNKVAQTAWLVLDHLPQVREGETKCPDCGSRAIYDYANGTLIPHHQGPSGEPGPLCEGPTPGHESAICGYPDCEQEVLLDTRDRYLPHTTNKNLSRDLCSGSYKAALITRNTMDGVER